MSFKPKKFVRFFRVVGYGFLILTLIEYLTILLFAQLGNAAWRYTSLGTIIDLGWLPLLGFLLIFIPVAAESLTRLHLVLMRALGWLAMVLGIAFLAAAFLVVITAYQADKSNFDAIGPQVRNGGREIQALTTQLDTASDAQIQQQLIRDNLPLPNPELPTAEQRRQGQEVILKQAQTDLDRQVQQMEIEAASQRKGILRSAFNWFLKTSVYGWLLIYMRSMSKAAQRVWEHKFRALQDEYVRTQMQRRHAATRGTAPTSAEDRSDSGLEERVRHTSA